MARDGSRHRRPRENAVAALPQLKKTESAMQRRSDRQVGILPRLLVRFGVMVGIVALGALVMVMQQKASTSPPNHDLEHDKEAIIETSVARRTTAYPPVEVLAKYPHDAAAFTQGFTVVNRDNEKIFVESTGLFGESSLRHVDIDTGQVLNQYDLPQELFGEGVTLGPKDELIMLTWKSKIGLVFDLEKAASGKVNGFTWKREFEFDTVTGEGWGITYDGEHLIVSDGSSTIMFWDPSTMQEVRRVNVTIHNRGEQEISQLNELEVAKGFIYANVWYQPYILKIEPQSGAVLTLFDMSKIVADAGVDVTLGAVLNGIAYDDVDDVFYVTGKHWTSVYKVRLVE